MSIKHEVQKKGWAWLRELEPSMTHIEAASKLGVPLCMGCNDPVHFLRPTSQANADDNSYSGNYGLGEFPFHTDFAILKAPPRYMYLRCEVGSSNVGTLLKDGFPFSGPKHLSLLARATVRPRRRTREGRPLLRLVERVSDERRIRWDPLYLAAASPSAKTTIDEVKQRLQDTKTERFVFDKYGDTLVLDNWRMLHAREFISDPKERVIARCYLESLW